MRVRLTVVLLSSLLTIAGCTAKTSSPSANASQTVVAAPSSPPAAGSPVIQPETATANAAVDSAKVDACALLTSTEIESVQGEAIKDTKLSGQSAAGFSMSQCFFTLPTFTNSISLLVAQRGEGLDSRDPEEFWRDTFHEDKTGAKEKGREHERGKEREEEEEGAPPQKVAGVGEEAYWTSSRVGGSLFVLKGNSYLRISIGGPADQATKIKRSKVLAQKALARL